MDKNDTETRAISAITLIIGAIVVIMAGGDNGHGCMVKAYDKSSLGFCPFWPVDRSIGQKGNER